MAGTNFPTSLDDSTSLRTVTDAVDDILAIDQNYPRDAIVAIETKLGITSSTPTLGKFLYGTGTGTTEWSISLDTDGALAANSDIVLPSQKAVKTYADTKIAKSLVDAKGDLITASANDTPAILSVGTNGQVPMADSNQTTGIQWHDPMNSLFRQAIINGNMDVTQRGTSIAMTSANDYTLDRWYCETATAGTDKTVSQEDGTGVNGSKYCARVKMVSDVDELLTFSQALESQDSIKFRGQKLTLSFYARGGAEFVADNATLVSKIVTGKGTDQKVLAFTTSANGVSQNNTLTTGWQKFTCTTTAAIASDITQIGVSFAFTHAGSGTTTNYFEITQVQLCAGDVALPFMPKSEAQEKIDCKRYYERITAGTAYNRFGTGWNYSTTKLSYVWNFQVEKRNTNYTLETTGTAGDYAIAYGSDSLGACDAVPALNAAIKSNYQALIICSIASGLTAGQAAQLGANNNAATYLAINNEL